MEHLSSPNITYALRTTGGDHHVLLCAPSDRVGDGSDVSANLGWRKAVVLLVGTKDESSGITVGGLRIWHQKKGPISMRYVRLTFTRSLSPVLHVLPVHSKSDQDCNH